MRFTSANKPPPSKPFCCPAIRWLLLLVAGLCLGGSVYAQVSAKLDVDLRRIINVAADGDATLLFDEQAAVGDPRAGTGHRPTNVWSTAWSSWYYPLTAVVDLGGNCQLTDISFFDANSIGQITVQALGTNGWVNLFADSQNRYLVWVTYPVSAQTRYLRIIFDSVNVVSPELVLYGWRREPVQPWPAATPPVPPSMDQFLGVNTVISDPLGRVEAFGCAREYHDWDWDEGGSSAYPNDTNQWFSSYLAGWNFDQYYHDLMLAGLLLAPCKQLSASWLGLADLNDKPIPAGSNRDPLQPASYVEHADHLYQFAARYGTTPVADGKLKLAASEPRLSGLGYVHYIENWNEPDKNWLGRDAYFLPYEYAALSSADADGHLGTMAGNVGIRKADPTAKLVMAGLAGLNLEYLKAMKYWCDQNRGGNVPWDVLNLHYYCNDAGGQDGATPTTGISPEAAGFRQQVAAIVDYRNRFLPGKEVWVSEFGYDVNPLSPQHAPAIGATPAEEVQGRWIIRSFLALAGAGVDRAFLFMLRDFDTTNATMFASSGLIEDYSHQFAVRPGWYYCHTLKERLRGLHYVADQNSGNTNVTIYQFADAGGAIKAYALWCPTTNNVTVTGYALSLVGNPATAMLVTLTNGSPLGETTSQTPTNNIVHVDVSEKPVLVVTGSLPAPHLPDAVFPLTTNMVINESQLGYAWMLTDEAMNVGDPLDGLGGNPTNIWFPSWHSADYPVSAYLDFGQVLPISKVYLYDANSIGLVTIFTGYPGNWQPVFQDGLTSYDSWNQHVINLRTRYLRLTRNDEGGNIGEIAVYTNAWLNQFVAPAITNITMGLNGGASLCVTGIPGSTIVLWSATNLTAPVVWQPVATNTVGTNLLWQLNDPVVAGPRPRYYRTGSP